MTQQQSQITGYRIFFPNLPPEDFPDVGSAWKRRGEYMSATGNHCYVHTLYVNGPEAPVGFG